MWKKIKNIYHFFIASLANFWHGSPSKNLIVIGITGTDGKTTTASLIHHILKSSGFSSSIISSIGAEINGRKYPLPFHVTTPPPFALQKFIKRAVAFKEKSYLVLEVTSHSLDQQRVFGINFEIGVITNITREHLDYHKTYENYIKAKTKLLEMSRIAVLNQDDESYELIKKELGEEGFKKLRRGWDVPIPNGETLKDVYNRTVPYYESEILPKLKDGKNVLVSAHGNSLRALVKYLDGLSDSDVENLEIATGEVIIYQIDENGKVVSKEIRKS